MKRINTNSSNEDSFKYAILCSIHYYDITHHPERTTKLKSLENNIILLIILQLNLK